MCILNKPKRKRSKPKWRDRVLPFLPQSLSTHKYLRIALLKKRNLYQQPHFNCTFNNFTHLLHQFYPPTDFTVFRLMLYSVMLAFSYKPENFVDKRRCHDWETHKSERYSRNGEELKIDFLIENNEVIVILSDVNTGRFRSMQVNIDKYRERMLHKTDFARGKEEDMLILSTFLTHQPDPSPASLVASIRPPAPINVRRNRATEWNLFEQQFTQYAAATCLAAQPEQVQIVIFMNCLGPEAVTDFNSLSNSPAEPTSFEDMKAAIRDWLETNYRFERYQFNKLVQEVDETFDELLVKVTTRAKKCQFKALTDDLIVDRIVCGIRDDALRTKLLETDDLSLQKATSLCRPTEACEEQVETVTADIEQKSQSTSELAELQIRSNSSTSAEFGPSYHQLTSQPLLSS